LISSSIGYRFSRNEVMDIREHAVVVLNRDIAASGLRAGDVGAVVHGYAGGEAFEVEFVTGSGQTLAVETLAPSDIRLLGAGEILHIRNVSAAWPRG
jgi:hypothetical protein